MSKASSTAITPKESSRNIHFKHQGKTSPGHYCLSTPALLGIIMSARSARGTEDDGEDHITMTQSVRDAAPGEGRCVCVNRLR
eukprot:4601528-Prymnesium_polylepis.1